jgi:predicted ATPase
MIKNILIKNFKSLENVDLELPKFALIVGYNGAGKTNLLTAIKFISLLTSGKQIEAVLDTLNILPTEFFYNTNITTAVFSLDLNIKSKSIKYIFEIVKLPNDPGLSVGKEILLVQNEAILTRIGNQSIIIRQENINLHSAPIVNNQLAISVFEGLKIVTEVKEWLSRIVIDTFEPLLLKNYGVPSKSEKSLSNNLAERMYYLKTNKPNVFSEVVMVFKRMIDGLESVDVEVTPAGNLVLKFRELNVNNVYRSFSASNGNLRTMGIILALYGDTKLSAIFIDEIENALHPSRIHSVINTLRFLAQGEPNHLQVVMTTHNPVVLDYVSPEEIVYCYKKGGKTVFINPYKNINVMYELKQAKENNLSLSNLFASGSLESIFISDLQ